MKTKIRFLLGNALAAVMDFGIGTALAAGIGTWYGVSLPWYLVCTGGVLSLLPDLDLVQSVIRGVSAPFDHRQTPFHRPLLVLPLAIGVAYLLGGEMWAVIAGVCVFGHYVHDTNFVGTSYGIAWFWPFSPQYWSVFVSFTPEVFESGSHHDWLRQNWLRPSLLSIREIGVGLVGFGIALWLMMVSPLMILVVVLGAVASVYSFWIITRRSPL